MNQRKNVSTFQKVSKFFPYKSQENIIEKFQFFKSLPAEIYQVVTKKALLGYTKK